MVTGKHAKFADDRTLRYTGEDVSELATKMSEDVKRVLRWCNTWSTKLSRSKTEVTAFHTKDTCDKWT